MNAIRTLSALGTLALLSAWSLALYLVPEFGELYSDADSLPLATTVLLNTYKAWFILVAISAGLSLWLFQRKKQLTPRAIYLSVGSATCAIVLGLNLVALTMYGLNAPIESLKNEMSNTQQ